MFGSFLTKTLRAAFRVKPPVATSGDLVSLGRIARETYAHVDDRTGRKLVRLGLCEREWIEGMGAGFYSYTITAAGRRALP